ncbi:Actin-like 6A [Rhizophlyctis rosea]|uniref:Actin-like 6A n=1 Tax=Rhizophlyctis rosea TaxID=64517 RepID=A0AAD5SH33_9FUNG|nr:Actin-like 6A [Rhizophlyctis rosea]
MATITYGGDEVSALVFDLGSSLSKVGYAGEDCPKAVFPSWVGYPPPAPTDGDGDVTMGESADTDTRMPTGEDEEVEAQDKGKGKAGVGKERKKRYVGENEIYTWRENVELKNPFKDGLVEDWDALEALWDHAYFSRLRADPTEHALLFSEPAWNPSKNREKLLELAFEKYNVPAFYLARSAVLSAFAGGRSTCLVIESGAHTTSAVPVYDGYTLKKGIKYQPYGGDFLTEQALLYFKQSGVSVVPHYLVQSKTAVDAGQPSQYVPRERPNTTDSFHRVAVERVVNEFKETVCHVSEGAWNEPGLSARPMKSFEFPDGYNNAFGVMRFRIPEVLFNPAQFVIKDSKKAEDPSAPDLIPIHQLAQAAVNSCDIDLRSQLYSTVLMTGANTMIPGFADRLYNELSAAVPGMKIKMQAAGGSSERKFGPWIGGSILASLGTFHQLWVSKREYEEIGPSVERRLW